MSARKGDWIQTALGRQFWPMDPRPEDVHLDDIAYALGMTCRFGGHCLRFYSVAEHSVHLARLCSPESAMWGLLHDAAEAYLVDVPRPVKRFLPGFKEAERAVELAVAERFGLPPDMPAEVKALDNAMLAAEQAQNMAPPPATWAAMGAPAPVKLEFWSPVRARREFEAEFRRLAASLTTERNDAER